MICIVDKKDCCGCWACVQKCPKQCISMREDDEDFLYPVVDLQLCIECGLCEKVCPVINQDEERRPLSFQAAKNPDEEVRLKSSSGGIFSMLAEAVIRNGGVIFGARFNENWEVVHGYSETMEGIAAFRGSKYVQSRIGGCYREAEAFLKGGRKVLFSGTPCQIAGLRHYLRKDYPNLVTVDLICHGVPSPGVFRQYLNEEKNRLARKRDGKNTVSFRPIPSVPEREGLSAYGETEIKAVSFRDKRKGWKKFSFVLVLSLQGDSRRRENSVSFSYTQTLHENAFLRGFLRDLYLRPSCHACPAKAGKSGSDITIADFWGIENYHPEFDDDKGCGLVLLNTEKGAEIYRNLPIDGFAVSFEEALAGNPSMLRSVGVPKLRKEFWRRFPKEGSGCIIPICDKRPSRTEILLSRVKSKIVSKLRKR